MPTSTPDARLQRRAWMTISALVLLIMLPNLVWLWIGQGQTGWMQAGIVPAFLVAVLFAACGERLWLACCVLTPFAILAPVETLYIAIYRHPTSPEILATLAATNSREMYEYLGPNLVPVLACAAAGLSIAVWAVFCSGRSRIHWRHRSKGWLVAVAIALPVVAGVFSLFIPARLHARTHMITTLNEVMEPGYPFGMIQRVAEYRRELRQVEENASRLDAYQFHAHRLTATQGRQVYVLVIGESSRRDHWQLFGYERATNPELSKIPNLVPFPNMVTAWPVSLMAIPQILTRKPITDTQIAWGEASVLRVMQEAGFDTWWISNQLPIGKFDSPVATYAFEAQHSIYLNHASMASSGSYDEDLLKPFRDVLRDSDKDLFVVLHMMGSHLSYDMRYPSTYRYFQPLYDDTDSDVAPGERMRNSYDNTILYTDHVLAQVIAILKASSATSALLYASDHGETLVTPSCSKAGHGIGSRYEFELPAFFWYSDAYSRLFPHRMLALRGNADKPSMSSDIFESLVDMAGVSFPGHDLDRSLFSTSWRYRPRIVNPIWQTDFDKAIFDKKCEIVLPPNADARQ